MFHHFIHFIFGLNTKNKVYQVVFLVLEKVFP